MEMDNYVGKRSINYLKFVWLNTYRIQMIFWICFVNIIQDWYLK